MSELPALAPDRCERHLERIAIGVCARCSRLFCLRCQGSATRCAECVVEEEHDGRLVVRVVWSAVAASILVLGLSVSLVSMAWAIGRELAMHAYEDASVQLPLLVAAPVVGCALYAEYRVLRYFCALLPTNKQR